MYIVYIFFWYGLSTSIYKCMVRYGIVWYGMLWYGIYVCICYLQLSTQVCGEALKDGDTLPTDLALDHHRLSQDGRYVEVVVIFAGSHGVVLWGVLFAVG